jgi:hypothetical protein
LEDLTDVEFYERWQLPELITEEVVELERTNSGAGSTGSLSARRGRPPLNGLSDVPNRVMIR